MLCSENLYLPYNSSNKEKNKTKLIHMPGVKASTLGNKIQI